MAPKIKGKKGKKGDDDDAYWEQAGKSAPNKSLAANDASDTEDNRPSQSKVGFANFADLGIVEQAEGGDGDEDDFGGLMSTLKATARSKDKKSNKKLSQTNHAEPEAMLPDSSSAAGVADNEADGAPGESDIKILSKKEKEKLKKEREKAKKKAQAAQKKAAEGKSEPAEAPEIEPEHSSQSGAISTTTPVPAPAPAPAATAALSSDPYPPEAEEEDMDAGKTDSKKKKKKKKKEEEPATAPAAPAIAPKKKGGISALKALMEERKRQEEEAKKREEEEQRRIQEEEERLEAEAKRIELEKLRKKDKEKAKRELLKKEGRLLTKKQKEEKARAELQKQALLASGVQIEGLQQGSEGRDPGKKVVYGTRKKKGPMTKGESPAPDSRPRSPELEPAAALLVTEPEPSQDGIKDDWDADSPDEAAKLQDSVKDDWDATSSEEEVEIAKAKVQAKEPLSAGTGHVPTGQTPSRAPPRAQPKAVTEPSKAKKPLNLTKPVSEPAAPISNVSKSNAGPSANAVPSDMPPTQKPAESSSSDSSSGSSDSSDSDSDSESNGMSQAQRLAAQRKAEAAERKAKAHEAALAARSKDNLRSPICCILGHVDTGKTKLLDKIRQTNVQEGEAGGITQQIGATYFPLEAIKTKTLVLNKDGTQEYKIPGLLVIDTPGHESFTNLRSRGSSLCNIAVLVVDIMHGLEPQTLESIRLLRDRKTPFIVALNKIDRMYGWVPTPDGAFRESLAKQPRHVQREFEDRVQKTIVAFAEQSLNACLYYENKNFARNVSLVPTSAITGEGVPDMIMLLVNLTQQRMSDRLMYLSELECTVLEVKVLEGLGTTIDVILSNGILREGDKIVVCGLNGPIVTQIRACLTPQPLRELRIKSAYVHHKEVKAALGVKIVAADLEKAIAGSRLLVVGPDDDEDDLRDEVMSDLTSLLNSIDKSGRGVCVQASTLGSLEALLDFLRVSKIPVSGINIGPVHKKDVMRAATMLERAKELACILCFDVPIDRDAERLAEEMGVRLFKADIIYHLFDAFTAYNKEIEEAKRRDAAPQAVWPCRLKVIAAFAKRDPIILGVDILEGTLRIGTPLAVVKVDPTTQKRDVIDLGKITSLEINHKAFDIVKKGQAAGGVAVKIEHAVYQSAKMFGRHFDDKDEVLSHISRQSIDVLKGTFRSEVTPDEWMLIKALKPRFGIQ